MQHRKEKKKKKSPILSQLSEKIGDAPGQCRFVGERKIDEPAIRVFQYDASEFREINENDPEKLPQVLRQESVTWIDVSGLHDKNLIEKICTRFFIHPLVIEDILETSHRPKMDEYDDYLFVILRIIGYDDQKDEIVNEQLSLILGDGFVLSFVERPNPRFLQLVERLKNPKYRIRKEQSDYLAYALMDATIDDYFSTLEILGEKIETLQEELLSDPQPDMLEQIHTFKSRMIELRRAVWPLRETIGKLERSESELIRPTTLPYFRDLYDNVIQVMDVIENYRDILAGMLDTFLSSVSNRMNEVMQRLTVIATLFIPLTFIVGVYGMNFEWMPELKLKWGYPAVWVLMIVITLVQLRYFRKKGWF